MENLRKKMIENADFFNDAEPSAAHFEKFAKKLDELHAKDRKLMFLRVSLWTASAAAVVVLVFFSLRNIGSGQTGEIAGKMPEEVKEMTFFYENKIEENYRTLNAVASCSEQKKEIEKCMSDFEQSMKEIQKDLENNPRDEHLINALVNHYQIRLEITERMINRAKEYCF